MNTTSAIGFGRDEYGHRTAERTFGTRRILGTDYPIRSFVRYNGPGRWVLTSAVCNGVAYGSRTYRTFRAALAALEG